MVEKKIDISISDRELRELIGKKGGLITPMVTEGDNFYADDGQRATMKCGCHNVK